LEQKQFHCECDGVTKQPITVEVKSCSRKSRNAFKGKKDSMFFSNKKCRKRKLTEGYKGSFPLFIQQNVVLTKGVHVID
jgi:hypothetical protein